MWLEQRRKRRGTTSPPLTNVEMNPGPGGKAESHKKGTFAYKTPEEGKKRQYWTDLT